MNRKIISSIVVLLVVGLLVAAIPPAKAQFVIASWDFPDEYGQGIYGFFPLENSSGDWWPYSGPMIYFDNDTIWYFSEEVYFDFLTVSGEIYTVTVTYEVYY